MYQRKTKDFEKSKLISKWLFDVFNSPKKQTKKNRRYYLLNVKLSKDTKKEFQNEPTNWYILLSKFVLTHKNINAIFKLEQKLLGLLEQFIDYSAILTKMGLAFQCQWKHSLHIFKKFFITRRFSTIDERMHHPH